MIKKVLHINTSDKGGAATACLRLHIGMLKSGIDSKMLVLDKHSTSNPQVHQFWEFKKYKKIGKAFNFFKRHIIPYLNERKLSGKPDEFEIFTFPNSLFDITTHPLYKEADIVHLHFVADFLNWSTFFRKNDKPVVWTLHDMNPFTGGCHYSARCKKFIDDCNTCPQLINTKNMNLSKKILDQKKFLLHKINNLKIISPSSWLKHLAEESQVFKNKEIIQIPHGIDKNIFKPHNRKFARELFAIPDNKFILLFAPDDFNRKNKGMDFIPEIINRLSQRNDILLCLVGKNTESFNFDSDNIIKLGYINNEQMMSLAYSSADLTLVLSREEAFSLTTLESLASGTPVIAFKSTGPDDIIIHKQSGWLAENYSTEDFSNGILWFIENPEILRNASEFSDRHTAENFSIEKQVESYLRIYNL
jgi:glycosyltransferase involved in cell wall biosynthesis